MILRKTDWILFLLNRSFRRNRSQTKVAFLTITLTIGLYASILFMIDSIDSGWMNYTRSYGGEQDFVIYKNPTGHSPTMDSQGGPEGSELFDYFVYAEKIRNTLPPQSIIYPRLHTNIRTDQNSDFLILATDIQFEYEYNIAGPEFNALNHSDLKQGLKEKECIINEIFAEEYGYNLGDFLTFSFSNISSDEVQICEIVAIYDEYTYTDEMIPSMVVDINNLWNKYPEIYGNVTQLSVSLLNPQDYYHLFDKKGTNEIITEIGGNFLSALGPGDFYIWYYEFYRFYRSMELVLALSFFSSFIGVGATLFCCIMYYNYLTTSFTEKIREAGILKALGARQRNVFQNIFIQGFLVGATGTGIGIMGAYLLFKFLFIPLFDFYIEPLIGINIIFTPKLISGTIALSLGLAIPILTSSILAFKISRWPTIKMLNPEHYYEEEITHSNASSSNLWVLLIFILVWFMFNWMLYIELPHLFFINNSFTIFNYIPILYFINIICGALILILFIPKVGSGIIRLLQPFKLKFVDILKIGLQKHQKRNRSITILVLVLFSNIVALVFLIQIIENQTIIRNKLECGSSINMVVNDMFRKAELDEIAQIDGVESVTGMLNYPWNLLEQKVGVYQQQNNDSHIITSGYSIFVTDSINPQAHTIPIFGIDSAFSKTIFSENVIMEKGDFNKSISTLFFSEMPKVLISHSVSQKFNVDIGGTLILKFYRDNSLRELNVEVSGIYKNVPGTFDEVDFLDFSQNYGIIINQQYIIEALSLETGENQFISRIIVKIGKDVSEELTIRSIDEHIRSNHLFEINFDGFEDQTEDNASIFLYVKFIVLFLFFSILLMALSGFLASAYSSFIERRTEIKIYRSLGLSLKDIKNLILIELFIILTANGILGLIIGIITSYIISDFISLFLNGNAQGFVLPPFEFIAILFGLTYGALLFLFHRIFDKKITLSVIQFENFQMRGAQR